MSTLPYCLHLFLIMEVNTSIFLRQEVNFCTNPLREICSNEWYKYGITISFWYASLLSYKPQLNCRYKGNSSKITLRESYDVYPPDQNKGRIVRVFGFSLKQRGLDAYNVVVYLKEK